MRTVYTEGDLISVSGSTLCMVCVNHMAALYVRQRVCRMVSQPSRLLLATGVCVCLLDVLPHVKAFLLCCARSKAQESCGMHAKMRKSTRHAQGQAG